MAPLSRWLVLLLALTVAGAGDARGQTRKFQAKSCNECHAAFTQKVAPLPNQHPGVKNGQCETCHLRHGVVPKLILKEDGNALCLSCHSAAQIGLDQPHVHTALKNGQCIQCHDPHASKASHLLSGEGAEACYSCHARSDYEKKVVHAVLKSDGCRACHVTHSSSEPNLLAKPAGALCLSCHDPSRGNFKKAHAGYPVEKASCATCHDPHSSDRSR